MIDLYYWPTPNGWKVTIALEELGLDYSVIPVNIGRGEQFSEDFLALSPNGRMPAIVDHDPIGGGAALSVFESGAILLYLAEKTGRLIPADPVGRYETIQWLMWQMGGLGPMAGQAHHFRHYAPEPIAYAVERYTHEVRRLHGVMNRRLEDRMHLACDAFTIADAAAYPWVVPWKRQGQDLAEHPHLARWFEAVRARPAVARGMAVLEEARAARMDDQAKKILFGRRDPP